MNVNHTLWSSPYENSYQHTMYLGGDGCGGDCGPGGEPGSCDGDCNG